MPISCHFYFNPSRKLRALALTLMAGIIGLMILSWGSPVFAQEDQPSADRPCSSCHPQESDAWMTSPHALTSNPELGNAPSATCQDCHGEYVKGHPDDGVMSLTVDSSACETCHEDTFAHWEGTVHATAGVQCISCHQSHSQTLRLTDDQLCVSCHRESLDDSLHLAHWQTDATCTSCHMTVSYDATAMAAATEGGASLIMVPSHDFVTVMSNNCLACHRQDVTRTALPTDKAALKATLEAETHQIYTLNTKLDAAQRSNRTLGTLSVVTLGVGLGGGGMLGLIFALFMAKMEKRKETL